MEKLKELITTYKDHPKKGVYFKDVLEITQHPLIFNELIVKMASSEIIKNAEALISIDARGFIFGSAISFQASKPLIFARKPGKLPGMLTQKKYSLEYGNNSLSIQKNCLKKFKSFAIIDDLLATGGTVKCVTELIKENNREVTGIVVVVELEKLKGRYEIELPIESIIKF
mgnify:CR=1 FL=1